MQTSPQEASFGHRGQPMVQVTFFLVPPGKAALVLESGPPRSLVPRENGAETEKQRMCDLKHPLAVV